MRIIDFDGYMYIFFLTQPESYKIKHDIFSEFINFCIQFYCLFMHFHRAYFGTRTTGTQKGVSCQDATIAYGIGILMLQKVLFSKSFYLFF